MRSVLDLSRGIILPGTGWRWVVVVLLALTVSALEAIGAVLVYALVGISTDAGAQIDLPLIGDLSSLAPGLAPDELVTTTAIGVAVFFVVRGAIVLSQAYIQSRVANGVMVELAERLLQRYLHLPYSFHLQRNSAQLIRNANESVNQILSYILLPAVRFIAESAVVLGLVAVLLVTAPAATGLAFLALLPVVLLVLKVIQPRIGRLGSISQREAGRSIQLLQQSLHGFRDIVVLGRQDHFVAGYRDSRRIIARTQYLRSLLNEVPPVAIETVTVGLVSAFIIFSTLAGEGPGSLAVVGLFAYAALRIMPALNKVVNAVNSMKFGRAALEDVQADLRLPLPPPPPDVAALPFERELVVQGVAFAYEGADGPTLQGLDLVIRRGESIGIVGSTGAGKSTLVDLLVGLSPPTEGTITVDGVDLVGNEVAWQRNLGMVSQQVFLLDDTLRRNIALGVPDDRIDEDALREAVTLAQLDGFIAELPHGLDTWVGERGTRVSGGQRQRIAIARALYPRPKVLFFDEGTSALDNLTEAALIEALAALRRGHTIVTIAHRLSTVREHDRILHLEAGRVVGLGSFDELLATSASFRELAKWSDA